ncbi:MAG: YdcF family protein [Terriglobales bacterium]
MRFLLKAGLAFCLIVLILLGLRHAGPALVVNQPRRSDLILLLAGDENDTRYWKGIELLRTGYAPRMLVDARADGVSYGRTPAELTEDFIRRSAGGLAVDVCRSRGTSTLQELQSAAACLQPIAPHTILLVTSDYHTRRALAIARQVYPGYSWSVAAANSGLLSAPRWWTDRQIAKNVLLEWQKMVWWELVERHK